MNEITKVQSSRGLYAVLEPLIDREWENACVCLQLSRQLEGAAGQILHRLFEQEQAHCGCLRGICTVLTGEKLHLRPIAAADGSREELLRGCYARQMRNLAAYEELARSGEHREVFSRLRDQEREHGRQLLLVLSGACPC